MADAVAAWQPVPAGSGADGGGGDSGSDGTGTAADPPAFTPLSLTWALVDALDGQAAIGLLQVCVCARLCPVLVADKGAVGDRRGERERERE